jgi:hypothetical protein
VGTVEVVVHRIPVIVDEIVPEIVIDESIAVIIDAVRWNLS